VKKIIIGIIASIAIMLGLAGTVTANAATNHINRPAACAGPCYHIESTGPGGCWKDQGEFDQYTVSTCSTASNFTIGSAHSYEGVDFYELLDGTGYCATLDAGNNYAIEAEACNAEAAQLWSNVDNTTPGYQTATEWDAIHDGDNPYVATKGSSSPYYLLETTGDGDNTLWETVCTSGC
jgi:hypothetical protein